MQGRGNIWFWIVSFAALCVAGFLLVSHLIRGSVYRAEAVQLYALLDRWLEAGQPEGVALTEFMQGRRPDLIVTNRTLEIDRKTYVTYFALTNPNVNQGLSRSSSRPMGN